LKCREPSTQWWYITSQKRGLLTYTTAETLTLTRKVCISLAAQTVYW